MASEKDSVRHVDRVKIVSDPSAPRLVADAFYGTHLTHAIDLALLMSSPSLEGQEFHIVELEDGSTMLGSHAIKPANAFREVARIRLDSSSLYNLIAVLIGAAVESEMYKVDEITELVNKVTRSGGVRE